MSENDAIVKIKLILYSAKFTYGIFYNECALKNTFLDFANIKNMISSQECGCSRACKIL